MRRDRTGSLAVSLALALLLVLLVATRLASRESGVSAFSPPGDGAAASWPTADGRDGAHHSSLADITPDNVAALEVAWVHRSGDVNDGRNGLAGTAFEATPVMVDGTLYFPTPGSRAVALDAETGAERWSFDPRLDRAAHPMVTSRGVSVWLDPRRGPGEPCRRRVFLAAQDARLFALDGASGRPCEDFGAGGHVDLAAGVERIEGREGQYQQSAPPAVAGDLVIVGSKIADCKVADAPSGVVRAFDARSGALRWSFEPVPGVGGVNEAGAFVPAGAANAWATLTVDHERDLVFVPTSSPSPDHWGGLRPGDNLYSDSLVALRASTGELVWHYQMVRHDLWDYDLPAPPALVTLRRGGREVPAVVQSTKMGFLFVLDRETGEPLFPVEERPVPLSDVPGETVSPTQPVPVLPPPLSPLSFTADDAWGLTPFDRRACRRQVEALRSEGIFTPPSLRGSITYPGFIGGMEWGGVAFDPASGLLVTNTNRLATVTTLVPARELRAEGWDSQANASVGRQAPAPYGVKRSVLLSPLGIPCTPPPWGLLHAVDIHTGAVRWEVPLGSSTDITRVSLPFRWGSVNLGGPLVAGGLVFIGASMDRRIRAFDLASGEQLWQHELPASAQATPLTYRARPGGRQYLVIAAGGHAGLRSRLGDAVVAFALPAAQREGGS
jgi:quinoprotein glucose dehydrogenase